MYTNTSYMDNRNMLSIIEVNGVLVSSDILTERFCCDLDACHGQCCVEGDAGAPVTLDEVASIEDTLDTVWPQLTAQAQTVIDKQGVAYTDVEGTLVTSIVAGRDCAFARHEGGCCLCALEMAWREGRTRFCKPISCALYPIREITMSNGTIGLNYHRWDVCHAAVARGRQLDLPIYKFLEGPLVRRFGREWYDELTAVADELKRQGYI